MSIQKHLDKDNLHHAYLLEGRQEEVVPEIVKFIQSLGIQAAGNPDFCHIALDSFKIEDARNLKSYVVEKGFSTAKKIFLISANSFLLEAQNSLLKIFEEPIENTHFFVIIPDASALTKTFISRFYVISTRQDLVESKDVEKFLNMPLQKRIDFIKELLAEPEDLGVELPLGSSTPKLDSSRSKALKFLNALETAVVSKTVFDKSMPKTVFDTFHQIFKVREFLRMPGSSTKTLLESVALVTPML